LQGLLQQFLGGSLGNEVRRSCLLLFTAMRALMVDIEYEVTRLMLKPNESSKYLRCREAAEVYWSSAYCWSRKVMLKTWIWSPSSDVFWCLRQLLLLRSFTTHSTV